MDKKKFKYATVTPASAGDQKPVMKVIEGLQPGNIAKAKAQLINPHKKRK